MLTFKRVAAFSLALLLVVQVCHAEEEPAIEKHRVGSYKLTAPGAPAKVYLQAGHDYGASLDPGQVSAARSGKLKWVVDKGTDGVAYQVTVPKTYEPGQPHGVVVFINSAEGGTIPAPIKQQLGKYRLIGICAEKSGNERDTLLRHAYAVQAVMLLAERYELDSDRIYVTGMSGGGRVASQVMIINSDIFTGGFPFVGANACIRMQVADSKGVTGTDPGAWKNTDKNRLAKAGREGRFAFMTGSKDYNKANVKSVYEGYKEAGFRYVEYIEQPGLGHGVPDAEHIEKALQFLDAPLVAAAEEHYNDAKQQHERGQLGEALVLYRKSSLHGRNADWNADAVAKAKELQAEYEAVFAAAEAAIASQDNTAFRQATQELRRTWGEIADRDVIKDLADRFRDAG